MRILDLFCGEGGAGAGYAAAGFDVVGVDSDPARLERYPGESHEGDALTFVMDCWRDFDAIHASPPCTGYSRGTAALPGRLERYDRLISATREVLTWTGLPFVIENVEDAKAELVTPLMLCWTMFRAPGSVEDHDGTPLWMRRHRLFETHGFDAWPPSTCWHPARMQCAGAYGGARRDAWEAKNVRRGGYVPDLGVMRRLLGTPWMSETGCFLSIPPAYTEHIGGYLAAELDTVRA